MEVKILQKFHDKADYNKVYLVGDLVTFDDERAQDLVKKGLVEAAVPEAEVVEEQQSEAEVKEAEEAEVVEETPAVTPLQTKKRSKDK